MTGDTSIDGGRVGVSGGVSDRKDGGGGGRGQ